MEQEKACDFQIYLLPPGEAPSVEDEIEPLKRSSWSLYEHDPFSQDIADYRERRRQALQESMLDLRAGKHMYSRRVLNVWAYQRRMLRQKRGEMAWHQWNVSV